jgi:hypothetical protein
MAASFFPENLLFAFHRAEKKPARLATRKINGKQGSGISARKAFLQ